MRYFLFAVLLLRLPASAFSQGSTPEHQPGKISGRVVDSLSGKPIELATITVFPNGGAKPVAGTSTDSRGVFETGNVPLGSLRIVIEFVGYRTRTRMIKLTAEEPHRGLGTIALSASAQELAGVTVTGQKKLIENSIDKLVYNAERDITSQTGVATDVLKKVPQVSVDVDGNVELEGNANVLFLINGKPSTIFGSNIADVLQSIPASQIKSIEVITNPGAKYDAQGTGGIINIVLKKSTLQGVNGNVSLTAGTIMENGSVNINARSGRFGVTAFFDGNARLSTTTPTSSQRVSTDTVNQTTAILGQTGSSNFTRHGLQSGLGFDWSDSDRNSLSGGVNYTDFGNRSNGGIGQSEQTQANPAAPFSVIQSTNNTNGSFRQYGFDPSLNYKHTFKNSDQQLEIGVDGSFSHNLVSSGNDQFLQPEDSLIYGTRNHNPAAESEYEAKIDYVQPLAKDVNLGIGGKLSGYDIASTGNALLWEPSSGDYVYNSALSNDLTYHQHVYAAYAEMNFPITRSVEGRLGSRYERTQVNAFYANAHQAVVNGYNTWIPSVFVMKKIDETQNIRLNFTIRINRPDYGDLNPFVNTSDPKNISTGNPDLKPEVWDRLEASYNRDLGKIGSFMIGLFYRQSNGDIQRFVAYYPSKQVGDTVYTNVSVTTRENIGIEENAGTNLFFELHLNDRFNVRSNTMFFYRRTINKVDPGYNSSTTIYRLNLNASYEVSSNFVMEFFGNFNSKHHEAQGFYPSFVSYSLAFRKQFWNKKGSIALTANNFLNKYVDQRTELYGPEFTSNSLRQVPYRSIGVNFTWKFGRLVVKKEKSDQPDTNLNGPEQ
ncbi:MAG TPA: outer membrane beta-barrel protein [Puia sp.]|nr:outer membrane beta-barrel protein [Puia sp.]